MDAYLQALGRIRGLGQRIERRNGKVFATHDIEDGAILTAFAPDGFELEMEDPQMVEVKGPLAERRPPVEIQALSEHLGVPAFGFSKLRRIIPDPGADHPPDMIAHCVRNVIDGNPYDGVDRTDIRTLAIVTRNYEKLVNEKANALMTLGPGLPAVLISVRPIAANEEIVTGRSARYLLGDDDIWGCIHQEVL